jgi:hypothetical protein
MSQQKRENIKKQVRDFLSTLQKEQLFRPKANFGAELRQQQELNKMRKERHEILDEILKRYKQGVLPLNRDKLNLFFIFYVLDDFVFNVEFSLKVLKALLDPAKIIEKFNPRTPYGFLIDRICNTLNLSEPHREDLKGMMFVELRNSIAHLDYQVDHHSFSYQNKGEKITYTIERLPELMLDYQALSEGFAEFIEQMKKN